MIITGTGIISTLCIFMTMILTYGIYNKLNDILKEIKKNKEEED